MGGGGERAAPPGPTHEPPLKRSIHFISSLVRKIVRFREANEPQFIFLHSIFFSSCKVVFLVVTSALQIRSSVLGVSQLDVLSILLCDWFKFLRFKDENSP